MTEPRDLGLAILAAHVSDWHFNHFQVEFRCAKNEVEVAERVEITEVTAIGGNPLMS